MLVHEGAGGSSGCREGAGGAGRVQEVQGGFRRVQGQANGVAEGCEGAGNIQSKGRVQREKGGKGREKEGKREKRIQEGGDKAGAISCMEGVQLWMHARYQIIK